MHAKHADDQRLNDLSGQVIDCVLAVLNTRPARPSANRIAGAWAIAGKEKE
jgi:hypothetical protein